MQRFVRQTAKQPPWTIRKRQGQLTLEMSPKAKTYRQAVSTASSAEKSCKVPVIESARMAQLAHDVLGGMPLPTSHRFIVPSSPTSDHRNLLRLLTGNTPQRRQ